VWVWPREDRGGCGHAVIEEGVVIIIEELEGVASKARGKEGVVIRMEGVG